MLDTNPKSSRLGAEMRASNSAFFHWHDAERGPRACVLALLWGVSSHCSDVETPALTLVSWHYINGFDQPCVWSVDFAFNDLSSVIFGQSTFISSVDLLFNHLSSWIFNLSSRIDEISIYLQRNWLGFKNSFFSFEFRLVLSHLINPAFR